MKGKNDDSTIPAVDPRTCAPTWPEDLMITKIHTTAPAGGRRFADKHLSPNHLVAVGRDTDLFAAAQQLANHSCAGEGLASGGP